MSGNEAPRQPSVVRTWLRAAGRRDVVMRSLKVAVIVGSLLTLINQGDALWRGALGTEVTVKILLTYCVPYAVSTYAAVAAILAEKPTAQDRPH